MESEFFFRLEIQTGGLQSVVSCTDCDGKFISGSGLKSQDALNEQVTACKSHSTKTKKRRKKKEVVYLLITSVEKIENQKKCEKY